MIHIDIFNGRMPRLSPKRLGKSQAQTAKNCDLRSGPLKPLAVALSVHAVPKPGALRTIVSLGGSWIGWTQDVDVVSSFQPDNDGRIHYTGDGAPKQTDLTMATSGVESGWPTNTYPLGVTKPVTALSLAFINTPAANIIRSTSYVYTLVTLWGEESAPSPATATVDVLDQQGVRLTGFSVPAELTDYVTHYRVYRLNVGDYGEVYQQVPYLNNPASPDMPVAVSTFDDTTYNDTDLLTDILETEGWLPPPATLKGLISLGNNMIAGFDGYEVYVCEPGYPFAFPTKYIINSDSPVVALGYYGSTLVITNGGSPILVNGTDPATMVPNTIKQVQPCVSKAGLVSADIGVLYPSYDGLFHISDGGGVVRTKGLFTKKQWNELALSSMIGVYHDECYYAFFSGSATGFYIDLSEPLQVVDFELPYPVYDAMTLGEYIVLLLGIGVGPASYSVYKFDAGATNETYEWLSRKNETAEPINYNTCRVEGDFSGGKTVDLDLIITGKDGVNTISKTFTESGTSRIGNGIRTYKGKIHEVQLSGTAQIDEVAIGQSTSEVTGRG